MAIETMLLFNLRYIKAMNAFGARKLLLNVSALQQSLSSLYGYQDGNLERVYAFYELLTLPYADLVARLQQSDAHILFKDMTKDLWHDLFALISKGNPDARMHEAAQAFLADWKSPSSPENKTE